MAEALPAPQSFRTTCSTAHWLIKTTKSSAGDPHAKEKDLAGTKDAGEFLRAN